MSAVEFLRDGLRGVLKANTLAQAKAVAREALRNFERTPTLDDVADSMHDKIPAAPPRPLTDPAALDATGRTRTDDEDTSKDASVDNFPKSGTQRMACLLAVAQAGRSGATASEVELTTGFPTSSVSKRLGELYSGGWLQHKMANGHKVRRVTSRQSRAFVYVLTWRAADELTTEEMTADA